ncbi:MAG: hypothetical protein FWH48_04960, partial [Oscillospiraceae bacterium]|nr:hypothetical protein [Oscillospiraceae bacterium]
EPINDALYRRDRLIEEKYNIKIKYTIIDDLPEMHQKAERSVMVGDNAFDYIISDFKNVTRTLAQSGLIYDFFSVPNVDLSKPWWSKYATRDMTINGKFYFPTGDITPRFVLSPHLLMFNKQLFMEYGLEFPYEKVLEGAWTLDMLNELIKGKGRDLNGDGIFDMANDFYGMVVEDITAFSFYKGFGENMIAVKDGNPYIALGTEKSYLAIEKVMALFSTNDTYVDPKYIAYEEVPPFLEGRTLFLGQTAANLYLFRDMEYDYGILPMPKLTPGQESYYSYCNPWGAVAVAVPISNENIERTGMIIEAFAALGKYMSTPAQYDVTLKTKFARDEYSEKMLDIISENATYDFGPIYDWGNNYKSLLDCMFQNNSFASTLEKTLGAMQGGLDKTIEIFENSGG